MLAWLYASLAPVAFADPPDIDGDGYDANADCNDLNANVHGANEIVGDHVDQNCDGHALCYVDTDTDGARTNTSFQSIDGDCRDVGEGVAADPIDCNDGNAAIHPGATEGVGDGIDQDCDTDELCYVDQDDDGARTTATLVSGDLDCVDPGEGRPSDPIDCADQWDQIHPGAVDFPGDGIDSNCDTDEFCYLDDDNDGARTTTQILSTDTDCDDTDEARAGEPIDCNDTTAAIHPAAIELAGDNVDQNCDLAELCWRDADNDGARLSTSVASTDADCNDAYEAITADPIDCNDTNPAIKPGVAELTGDGIDQNCDGDEVCYADLDNDDARSPSLTVASTTDADCNDATEALTTAPIDCLDTDPAVYPGAPEVVGDGVDQSCDSREACHVDSDGDGARTDAVVSSIDLDCVDAGEAVPADPLDCDDADATSYPGAPEIVGNEVDNDCNGGESCWLDADDDDARVEIAVVSADPDCDDPTEAVTGAALDCDDGDAAIHPGATELTGDGTDQDCDGLESCFVDGDDDGARGLDTVLSSDLACGGAYQVDATAPFDCDDAEPTTHPGAEDVCDGVDNDCDAAVDYLGCDPDDLDNDGVANEDDAALCEAVGLPADACDENPDLDDDGVVDGTEVGADPSAPLDTDGDALPDYFDTDDDDDLAETRTENGIDCAEALVPEYDAESAYWRFVCGGVVYDFGSDLVSAYPDLDGDAQPDFRDADDDGDGVDSAEEGTGDVDCDGVVNLADPDDTDGPCAEVPEPVDTAQPVDTGSQDTGTDGGTTSTDGDATSTDGGTTSTDGDTPSTDDSTGTEPVDTGILADGAGGELRPERDAGCGCTAAGTDLGVTGALVLLIGLVTRRRRA